MWPLSPKYSRILGLPELSQLYKIPSWCPWLTPDSSQFKCAGSLQLALCVMRPWTKWKQTLFLKIWEQRLLFSALLSHSILVYFMCSSMLVFNKKSPSSLVPILTSCSGHHQSYLEEIFAEKQCWEVGKRASCSLVVSKSTSPSHWPRWILAMPTHMGERKLWKHVRSGPLLFIFFPLNFLNSLHSKFYICRLYLFHVNFKIAKNVN